MKQKELTIIKEDKNRFLIKIWGEQVYVLNLEQLAILGDRIRNLCTEEIGMMRF